VKPYYQDESVQIFNADCRDVLPTLDTVDVVITDPPYGVGLESHRGDISQFDPIKGDSDTYLAEWLVATWSGSLAMFMSPFRFIDGDWRSVLVWDKGAHVGGGGDTATCWKRDFELIGVRRNAPLNGGRDSAIVRYMGYFGSPSGHPAEKPIELMRYLAGKLTPQSATILDPFMGSGTTLRAAKDLGRKAIGIEIEERYCEIAANRMSQLAMSL
jgi:hypothetical protein